MLIWIVLPALLVWALRDIPLAEIRRQFSQLNLGQVLALAGLNILILLLLTGRWWLILMAQGQRLPYLALFRYRMAAFSVSYLTPGTQFGGEPLQVFALQKHHHLSGSTALTAVTLDKLFELLANFTFLATGIWLVLNGGLIAGLSERQAALVPGLLALPLGYLLLLWAGVFPLTWLATRLPNRLAARKLVRRAVPLVVSTERQITGLFRQRPAPVLAALVLSGLIWILLIVEYWLMLSFLGARLNLFQTITALTAARLAFLLPVPAGVGALEGGQILAMQALGFPAAVGIGASLLIRARDLAFGALGLWWASRLSQPAAIKPEQQPAPAGD
jgi:uncharacterized membrane protein YbhN (UPF0104 family)